MAVVLVHTNLKLADYQRLEATILKRKTSLYSFIKEAVIEKMQREGI